MRCKHKKNGYNCGSYAFNLHLEGIDQGDLCDVHYWQNKAIAQPAPVQDVSLIDEGKTAEQRPWIRLTTEDIESCYGGEINDFARAIETKFIEKNT